MIHSWPQGPHQSDSIGTFSRSWTVWRAPALLRSGRIELWLDTVLPDSAARTAIVEESVLKLPPPICLMNVSALVSASQGLTGADLKSVVEDGKLLFAHDRVTGRPLRPVEEYFLEAIETVRTNRRNYLKRRPGPFGQENRIGFGRCSG